VGEEGRRGVRGERDRKELGLRRRGEEAKRRRGKGRPREVRVEKERIRDVERNMRLRKNERVMRVWCSVLWGVGVVIQCTCVFLRFVKPCVCVSELLIVIKI